MKNKTISNALIAILLVALIGVIAFVAIFTNGFSRGISTFVVKVDGELVVKTKTITLQSDATVQIQTAYLTGNHAGYQFAFVPHKGKDFTFLVNGERHNFSDETDLSAGFDFEKTTESLTLYNKGLSLESILSRVYSGQTVQLPASVNQSDDVYVDLIIADHARSSGVVISLLFRPTVSDIILDKDGIVFYD